MLKQRLSDCKRANYWEMEKDVYFGCNLSQILFWGGSGRSSRPVQWAGYLSSRKRRSICLSVVCSWKKTSSVVEEMPLNKYSTEVSRFCLGNSGKIEFRFKCDSMKVCNTPWKYQGQKKGPLNYAAFLLIALANSKPFLIHSRKFHMLYFHPQSFPCLQTYCLGFSLIQKDVWAMASSEWELYSPVWSLRHTLHARLQPLWNEGKQTAFILWFSLSNT